VAACQRRAIVLEDSANYAAHNCNVSVAEDCLGRAESRYDESEAQAKPSE
jgi:hypothetical protein